MNTESILLVEDTRSTIDLINTTLKEKGFEVSVAKNGIQALKIAPKLKPDLILLDILMPEMDGYETCRLLKENINTKEIPVIFLSALNKPLDKVKAFALGGVDYISKPIETEELLARIQTHLTINRLKNELKKINENLEEKVKIRTAELNISYAQLEASVEELSEKTQKLQDSEEFNTMLLNNIMYPVSLTTFNGKFLYMNQSCANILGIDKNNITGLNIIDHWVYPSQRQQFIKELKEKGAISNLEILLKNNRGNSIISIVSSNFVKYFGKTVILNVFNDITRLRQLEKEIIRNTIETEEKERLRIARDLHDGLCPILSSAKMFAQWCIKTKNKEEIPEFLIKTIEMIDNAYNTSRDISHNISPLILQNLGIIEAIRLFIENNLPKHNIKANIQGGFSERYDIQKETIIYRLLTECVNNTIKHANASIIEIQFKQEDGTFVIIYSDDGIGFNVNEAVEKKHGIGLLSMKSRIEAIGGTMGIDSKRNFGTVIRIEVGL